MKYWFRLFLLIGAIVAVFAVIGSLLPRSYDFATRIEINAAADEIFPQINTIPNWKNWTQWNPAEIPGLTVQYSGGEAGEGATQSWTDLRGNGKLWITKSIPNKRIEYDMLFTDFPNMSSQIELLEANGKTNVRWSSRGRLPGGPFYGFFAPFFSTQMRNQYDQSLTKLKELLEAGEKSLPKDSANQQVD
jgi:uncharacterized membrane protein